MARRISEHKFESAEIQGPGSFVKFRMHPFNVGAEYRGKVIQLMQRSADKRRKASNRADALLQVQELSFEYAREYFIAWDWVDWNGVPLAPFPDLEDPKEVLTEAEVSFIFECFRQGIGLYTPEDKQKAQENGQDINFPASD